MREDDDQWTLKRASCRRFSRGKCHGRKGRQGPTNGCMNLATDGRAYGACGGPTARSRSRATQRRKAGRTKASPAAAVDQGKGDNRTSKEVAQDAGVKRVSKGVGLGTCCSSRVLTACGQSSTACRRRAEHNEVHKSTVEGANAVGIVERPVEPTRTTATRKFLTPGKHGIVVTTLRQTQATRSKGRCTRRK